MIKREKIQNRVLPIAAGTLLILLFGVSFYRFFYQARVIVDLVIIEHMQQFETIFKKINNTCVITAVAHDTNYIDFLNVRSFVGSEVGSLNLAYPKQWQGPYVKDNPTIQGHLYQIVKTKHGYYIVPGMGVRLTSGKIMGKDIIITRDTDIQKLIDTDVLRYQGKSLAVPLPIKGSEIMVKPEIFATVDA